MVRSRCILPLGLAGLMMWCRPGVASYNEKRPGDMLSPAYTGYGNAMLGAKTVTDRATGYLKDFLPRLVDVSSRMAAYTHAVVNISDIAADYHIVQRAITNLTLEDGLRNLDLFARTVAAQYVGRHRCLINLCVLGADFRSFAAVICWRSQHQHPPMQPWLQMRLFPAPTRHCSAPW